MVEERLPTTRMSSLPALMASAVFGSALSDPAEIALYAKFWIALAIVLGFIAYWAQRRLRWRS